MFEVPVLLIVFNRPQAAQKVFNELKKIRPKQLFVAADGPRPDKPDEVLKCEATREIFKQIDWPCELKTLFRDKNRGCGHGPAEAITWFFEQVEAGIILEDDCVPSAGFFPYCSTLLKRYKEDETVYMISGTNALKSWRRRRSSYFYSLMGHSLGWATWRRAWQKFDYSMEAWKTKEGKKAIRRVLNNQRYFRHFKAEFDKIYLEEPNDVWDFQWLFARWLNGGKTIVPSVNLISNIGFNADATHSFNENDLLANLPLKPIVFPLKRPKNKLDTFFDWYVFERFINTKKRSFVKKLLLKSVKLLLKYRFI